MLVQEVEHEAPATDLRSLSDCFKLAAHDRALLNTELTMMFMLCWLGLDDKLLPETFCVVAFRSPDLGVLSPTRSPQVSSSEGS